MKVKVLVIVCYILLTPNLTSSQSKSSSLEKIADSIYFNLDDYSNIGDFIKGLKLFTQLLSSIDDSKSAYYYTILGWIVNILGVFVLFYMWIMSLINAVNEKEKPVPILGEKYIEWFKNI